MSSAPLRGMRMAPRMAPSGLWAMGAMGEGTRAANAVSSMQMSRRHL
jgi:hypothetical protein